MDSSDEAPADAASPQDRAEASGEDSSQPMPTTEASPKGAAPDDDDEGLEEDDLFGDDDDDDDEEDRVKAKLKRRQMSDPELDSGDDEGRDDRADDEEGEFDEDAAAHTQAFSYMPIELTRHFIPESSDNEMYLMKVPQFLSVEPTAWHHTKFQPPITDHHSKFPPSSTFSPYNTAMTTIRWRHSPSNPEELQSNARILRWSDGSLTLQLATDPTTQYEIDTKSLAPPQRNPLKPTPTSIIATDKNGLANGVASAAARPQDPTKQESFTFLCAPVESSGVMRVTNKLTAALTVNPSANDTDDALERLASSIAAAAARGRTTDSAADAVAAAAAANLTMDPELMRKQAEAAERDKARVQRRREAQETRERERANRVLAPRGFRAGHGLSSIGLEDDEMGGAAPRARTGRVGKTRRPRREDMYSDEEDFGRRRTIEDEYDEEDDFIAKSDEEDEDADAVGTDDEDMDMLDDDEEELAEEEGGDRGDISRKRREKGRARQKDSPKRNRAEVDDEDAAGDDVDAEGEDEDAEVQVESVENAARAKRRRIVDEDDEDE